MAKHVALKSNYNDGGEGVYVGFSGTCSEETIKWNVDHHRPWCSHKDKNPKESSPCRKYYIDRGFKGPRPVDACYESMLFRKWQYGAGSFLTGEKAGGFKRIRGLDEGRSIAVLTTVFPKDKEIKRRIIGFYRIAKVNNDKETMLIADKSCRVRLPMEEAKELSFWDYYRNKKGGVVWGSNLHRFLDEDQVARILTDLRKTLRGEDKAVVDRVLATDFHGVLPSPASGPRIPISGENRNRRIWTARKYGPGGEGDDHKRLKKWVTQNPDKIGLTNPQKIDVEYRFRSGDQADILFSFSGNRYAVVEIETTDPYPSGCYQALKYRVLKCAEIGKNILSPEVEAILVAYSIPQEAKDFCIKYGIRFVEEKI